MIMYEGVAQGVSLAAYCLEPRIVATRNLDTGDVTRTPDISGC